MVRSLVAASILAGLVCMSHAPVDEASAAGAVRAARQTSAPATRGASPVPRATPRIPGRTTTSPPRDTVPWWLPSLVGVLLGGGGLGAWAFKIVEKRGKRKSTLHQIRYYLRRLYQLMSVAQSYPEVQLWGFDDVIMQLSGVAISNDGAAVLSNNEREAVYEAVSVCQENLAFLASERPVFVANPREYREYMIAAALRSLTQIRVARAAVGDTSQVRWPSDPQGRHLWRVGEDIPGDEDDESPANHAPEAT